MLRIQPYVISSPMEGNRRAEVYEPPEIIAVIFMSSYWQHASLNVAY